MGISIGCLNVETCFFSLGSSLFLKKKYGAGYHLVIVKDTGCDVDRITDLIRSYIPEVGVNQNVGAELTYLLPSEKSNLFQYIFQELEQNRRQLGISSYGASVTTMEEVGMWFGLFQSQLLIGDFFFYNSRSSFASERKHLD